LLHSGLVGCWVPCCSPQSETFPPQPPPPASPRVLFGCFAGSTSLFDSSPAFMHGLRFWLPVPIRRLIGPGCRRGLPVLARAVSRRAHGSGTMPDLTVTRDGAPVSVAFPLGAHGRHPDCVFRSSIPGPSMPLSTLHPAPRGAQRKTRGQDGSLLLSCGALSSPTARRFIPAIALANVRGPVTASLLCLFCLSARAQNSNWALEFANHYAVQANITYVTANADLYSRGRVDRRHEKGRL